MNEYNANLLISVAIAHAQSKGYTLSSDVKNFISQFIIDGERNFYNDPRTSDVKMDLTKRNIEFLIDRILSRLEPSEKEVQMHEWIHGITDWICPLFPLC